MPMEVDLAMTQVTAYDPDGYPVQGADFYGETQAGVPAGEQLHPLGILSRARDPEVDNTGQPSKGATMMRLIEGSQEHSLALSDPRAVPKLPQNDKGGTILYADTGAAALPFVRLSGTDGTFQVYVPYGNTAATIAIDVSTQGQESIQIVHGSGMAIRMVAGGANAVTISNKAGDAYVSVDDNGVTLNGNGQLIGGLAVGVPSPPGPPPPMPVARAAELVTWAASVQAALTAITTGLSTPGPLTGPIAVPPVAPLASTVTAEHLSTT